MKFHNILILFCVSVFSANAEEQDCSLSKFLELNLIDLIKESSKGKECLAHARMAFKTNYAKAVISLRGPFVEDPTQEIEELFGHLIYLQSFDIIKYVLKNFCDLIERFVVSFEHIHESDGQKIITYISNTCFTSMEVITLDNCYGRILNGLQNVFYNVFNLKYSSIITANYPGIQTGPEAMKFNQLFPNVHTMILENTIASDWVLLDGKMPKMVKFNVQLSQKKDENQELTSNVIRFFKMNPQIRHLIIKNANLRLLKEAKDLLQQLSFLEIPSLSENYLNYVGEPIHFETLRYLVILSSTENQILANVVFNQLEWLSWIVEYSFTEHCMTFIEKQVMNTNLTKLTLYTRLMSKDQFLALPEMLPNLQSVSVETKSPFVADDIFRFIKKRKYLEEIVLNIQMNASEREILNDNLEKNWINNAASGSTDIISLKRLKGCPAGSLNDVKLHDLLKRSSISKECLDEARDVFLNQYSKVNFVMHGPIVVHKHGIYFDSDYRTAYFQNVLNFDYLINNFGDLISLVEISFDAIHIKNAKNVIKLLNINAETIEKLKLENCKGNVLDELTQTFQYAHHLLYSSSSVDKLQIKSKNRKMCDLFPELNFLHLQHTGVPAWEFIVGTFPRLRKLIVELPRSSKQNNILTVHLVKFLKMNTYIQNLVIENSNLRLLQEVNATLTQLESLELLDLSENYDNLECPAIQFSTVEFLAIESTQIDEIPLNIMFERLSAFNLKIQQDLSDKWLTLIFFQINLDVRRINIDAHDLGLEYFLKMPNFLYHVKMIYIICQSSFKTNDLVRFVEKSKYLRFLDMRIYMTSQDQLRLNASLSTNWEVKFYSHADGTVSIALTHKEALDCSRTILDGLSMDRLHEKSMLSEECLQNSQDSFVARHDQPMLVLLGPLIESMAYAITEFDDRIYVRNVYVIRQVLNNFGRFINTIAIDFENLSVYNAKTIVKYLNDKCYKIIFDLRLLNCRANVLDELKNQFTRISSLEFSSSATQTLRYSPTNRKFSELFPNLNYLSLEHMKATDWTFINGSIRKLFNFNVKLPDPNEKDGINESQIARFLAQNSQIEQFVVSHPNFKLFKVINESLPHLKYLRIVRLSKDYTNDKKEQIELTAVRHLMLLPGHEGEIPTKITFTTLERLDIKFDGEFNNKWMQFVLNQVNGDLDEFTLACPKITKTQFLTFPEHFGVLHLAGFETEFHLLADDILSFIAKSSFLENLELNIHMDDNEQQRLNASLTANWSLNYTSGVDEKVIVRIRLRNPLETCKPGTLDELNPSELLEYSSFGSVCLNEAQVAFHKNFANSTFVFSGPLLDDVEEGIEAVKSSQNRKMIVITHFKTIIDLLYHFGSSITSLIVNFDEINVNKGKQIVDYISDRCFKQLKSLELKNCKGNVVDGLYNGFHDISSLWFSSSFTQKLTFDSVDRKLNNYFQRINTLCIDHSKASDWAFLDVYLPNLETFSITLSQTNDKDAVKESQITSFFRKNVLIKRLTVIHGNLKLLNDANEYLEVLTDFTLKHLAKDYSTNYHGEPVYFNTVTNFVLKLNQAEKIPEKIMFMNLEKFTLDLSSANYNNKWTQFMIDQINANLIGLSLNVGLLSKEQFLTLADKLPNIQEVDISCTLTLLADDILTILFSMSRTLRNIELDISMDDSEQQRLKEILSDEWKIEYLIPLDSKVMMSIHRIKSYAIVSTNENDNNSDSMETDKESGAIISMPNTLIQMLAALLAYLFGKLYSS